MLGSRRFAREMGLALVVYLLLLAISVALLVSQPLARPLRAALALLPVLGGFGVIWAVLREQRRVDELARRILQESLAFAFAGTMVVAVSWGLLENVGFPHVSAAWLAPVGAFLWALGEALAKRRYR